MDAKANTQICFSPPTLSDDETEVASPSVFLIMVSGGMPGSMLRLDAHGTTIGRSAESTYQLLDATVSRRHALFLIDGSGGVHITDLGSTNGTFVEGERIPTGSSRPLASGERIQLGKTVVMKLLRLDPNDERFQRELFERSVRDPLTGLYNRAYFLDQIAGLAHRCSTGGMGLAVMMLDVDHFKQVNDRHGHVAGDQVLREVAEVLRESTRNEDLVARYGGEEFVAALPVRAPDMAAERAERIRWNLANRRVAAPTAMITVTASLGIAYAAPGRNRGEAHLIMMADQALYEAKSAGRDRVIFAHSAMNGLVGRTETAEFEIAATPGAAENAGRSGPGSAGVPPAWMRAGGTPAVPGMPGASERGNAAPARV